MTADAFVPDDLAGHVIVIVWLDKPIESEQTSLLVLAEPDVTKRYAIDALHALADHMERQQ